MKIRDYLGEAETVADKKNDKLEKKMAKGVAKLSGVTNAADTDPERERLQNEQLHPLVAEHFGIIDELSKKTLGSYVKKATGGLEGAANQAYEAGRRGTEGGKNFATAVKRVKGVDKAVNKLTKEETIAELSGKALKKYLHHSVGVGSGDANYKEKTPGYKNKGDYNSLIAHKQDHEDLKYDPETHRDDLAHAKQKMHARKQGIDRAVNKLVAKNPANKLSGNYIKATTGLKRKHGVVHVKAPEGNPSATTPYEHPKETGAQNNRLSRARGRSRTTGVHRAIERIKEEVDVWSVKNIKTGQVYHSSSKYPITKNSPTFKKIKAAGGDHIHAALYKNGKLVEEETISELKTSTLQSYADKAHQQAMDATYDAAHLNRTGEEKLKANAKALASKRAGGVQLAQSKIDRKDQMEEVYYETLDLFLEALMSPEVRDRIKAHELAGHKTSDHASRMKNGEMEYSFVVTQPSGKRSRHIYHGSKTKHETMSPAPKSKEAHEAGEDDDDK